MDTAPSMNGQCRTRVALRKNNFADIVSFQETKLTRAELDRDLALIDGW